MWRDGEMEGWMDGEMEEMRMFFIAILASQEIEEQVSQYKHWMKEHYGCKVAMKSPAHITLVAPFSTDPDTIKKVETLLEDFVQELSPFDIAVGGFGAFDKRVIFLEVKENELLNECYKKLNHDMHALLPELFKLEKRPFHPHITIANRDIPLSGFKDAFAYFSSIDYKAQFNAHKITLLQLEPGKWKTKADFLLKGKDGL